METKSKYRKVRVDHLQVLSKLAVLTVLDKVSHKMSDLASESNKLAISRPETLLKIISNTNDVLMNISFPNNCRMVTYSCTDV